MKKCCIVFYIFFFFVCFSPVYAGVSSSIIVNHDSVSEYAAISNLTQTKNLKSYFQHASVGGNINGALDVLAQDGVHTRGNWIFDDRGNPGWQEKVDMLLGNEMQSAISSNDVLSFKYCYIDQDADWIYYRDRMRAFETANPTKYVIWWTMPIMSSGSDNLLRRNFNNSLRTYAANNPIILFDIADIESHDLNGNLITSSGYEAMYSGYCSDCPGGAHLNSTGGARMAKAFWVLMSKIAMEKERLSCDKPGDIDCSGQVNILDLAKLILKFGQNVTGGREDVDSSGQVNSLDLSILLSFIGL